MLQCRFLKGSLNLTRLLRLRFTGKRLFSRDFGRVTLKGVLRIFLEKFEVILSRDLRLPKQSRIEVQPLLEQPPVDGHQVACSERSVVVTRPGGRLRCTPLEGAFRPSLLLFCLAS